MPADDTQSSSWGSSQRPPSHLCRSLAAAGRRSTRQTRLRTSEWMHQGGTMARHQVHRCRWLACRRRSAAPPITISRLSRGKTVEKCTGSRPARKSKSPERLGLATTQFALRHSIDAQHQWVCPTNNHTMNYVLFSHSTNSQQTNVLITFAFPFTTIDFFLELTDNQRQCVLIYQLDAVGVLAKGEHRHRVPGSLACPRGCAGSLGLRK